MRAFSLLERLREGSIMGSVSRNERMFVCLILVVGGDQSLRMMKAGVRMKGGERCGILSSWYICLFDKRAWDAMKGIIMFIGMLNHGFFLNDQ